VKFLLVIVSLVSLLSLLSAEMVEVIADKFYADEKKQVSEFIGNVVVTKGKDKLVAKKIVINFDKKRQPIKYTATGDAKIDMIMNDKVYFGKAQTMIYNPIKDQYILIKDAFLYEKVTNKKVYGEKIYVNQATGRYEVESDGKKPVKFIFKIEDKKKK